MQLLPFRLVQARHGSRPVEVLDGATHRLRANELDRLALGEDLDVVADVAKRLAESPGQLTWALCLVAKLLEDPLSQRVAERLHQPLVDQSLRLPCLGPHSSLLPL